MKVDASRIHIASFLHISENGEKEFIVLSCVLESKCASRFLVNNAVLS